MLTIKGDGTTQMFARLGKVKPWSYICQRLSSKKWLGYALQLSWISDPKLLLLICNKCISCATQASYRDSCPSIDRAKEPRPWGEGLHKASIIALKLRSTQFSACVPSKDKRRFPFRMSTLTNDDRPTTTHAPNFHANMLKPYKTLPFELSGKQSKPCAWFRR